MTDYHDLNTPEKGAGDWHLPLNENFRTLDQKIEIRDEAAARSDYPPKAGAKYLATDTGAQWIGDGDAWNRLASTGESPEFASISHRDPSGQTLQRDCLLAKPSDGDYISIPAEGEYEFYYIRVVGGGCGLRISFNESPGDTTVRETLVEEGQASALEIYVVENEGIDSKNTVGVFGAGTGGFKLDNDPIDEIYLDQPAIHAEAWGIKYV